MIRLGNTIVSCTRVTINPCALDEYEVIINPFGNEPHIINTLGGLFESDDAICLRVYKQWLSETKIK